jgi:hypothetical protein
MKRDMDIMASLTTVDLGSGAMTREGIWEMCVHQIRVLSLYTNRNIVSVIFIILIAKLPISTGLSSVNMLRENKLCSMSRTS